MMQGLSMEDLEEIGRVIPAGTIIIDKETYKVVYVNQRAIELYGFNPTGLDFKEYALNELKMHRLDNGYPYLFEQLPLIRALSGETTHNQELTFQRPDNSKLTVVSHSAPLINAEGKITGAIATFEDVSEVKKVEQALKQTKQRVADILESIDDYVYALDRNWNFIYVNEKSARDWDCEPDQLISKNYWQTFPKFIGTEVEHNFREAMSKREIRRFEWKTIYLSGYREFTVFPSAEGITIYGKDITERKVLQQKLEEYSKNLEKLVEERTKQLKDVERLATIGQTAGMVGHDIRNPLQAIVNELYFMKHEWDAEQESKMKQSTLESINMIQEQVDYISKIVSDLQDYARSLQPNLVEVNICKFIPEALRTINLPNNIQASAVCEENMASLKLDFTFLKRILSNLVTNAIQAMPQGGKLTIHAYQEGSDIFITVQDTGVGIPPEAKDKLFKPLFTTKAKGQGFGLAVVKRMTEAMNGTIAFESQIGKGTKFILKFPKNTSNELVTATL